MYENRKGEPLELVLYKYDSCWFCQKVLRAIDALQLNVAYRDTRRDTGALEELMSTGGRTQVPCLFVNGRPLYESDDIVHFLETEVFQA